MDRRDFLALFGLTAAAKVVPSDLPASEHPAPPPKLPASEHADQTTYAPPFKRGQLSLSYSTQFVQYLEYYHGPDAMKVFQEVLTEALERELGGARGTLTHFWTADLNDFFRRIHFVFKEDGKNGRENLWGWDVFLPHAL